MRISKAKADALLLERGMQIKELAIDAKIHPSTYTKLDRRRKQRFDTICKIAKALGVKPEEILEKENERPDTATTVERSGN